MPSRATRCAPVIRRFRPFVGLAGLSLAVAAAVPRTLRAQEPPDAAALTRTPLADSLAPLLVFPPSTQRWFVAASRTERLLLDVGRLDADTKKRPDRIPVAAALTAERGVVRLGDQLLLRGTWGREVATVEGFDVYNGRLVARLGVSAAADSAARAKAPAVASAWLLRRGDAVGPDSAPVMPECPRDSLLRALKPRLDRVRDSLVTVTRGMVPRITVYQQARRPKPAALRTTRVAGCFDQPRVAVAVSLRGELNEWVAQRVVLVGADGRVQPVRLEDRRFTGHELLAVADADGDGRDDLITRAVGEASGGTTILRWDGAGKRFVRLAAGFQWESR